MRKINEQGKNLLKSFEGCRLRTYKDIGSILTIGYGHTGPEVYLGQNITQDQAEALLLKDLLKFEGGIEYHVKAPTTDNQFSALVCLSYNIGMGHFKDSTLLKMLNAKDYTGAADQFLRWDKVNGQIVEGLHDRRGAERALFLQT